MEQAIQNMTDARTTNKWGNGLHKIGGTGGDNVLTGFINDDGVSRASKYPCHHPINGFKSAEILWSAFGYRTSPEIAKAFHHWLVTESPWAKTGIVPKDLTEEFMFTNGFVFTDLRKTPGNLLHNFLIATRMDCEWPSLIKAWYELVTKGFDPSFAFLMLTVFVPFEDTSLLHKGNLTNRKKLVLAATDKYDWPLDMARATQDYVLNFLNNNPEGCSTEYFSPTAKTIPVNTLWGKLVPTESEESYVSILKKLYSELGKPFIRHSGFFNDIEITYHGFSSENILEIMKREEVRLGIKMKDFKWAI